MKAIFKASFCAYIKGNGIKKNQPNKFLMLVTNRIAVVTDQQKEEAKKRAAAIEEEAKKRAETSIFSRLLG
jgi:hypothetical protein